MASARASRSSISKATATRRSSNRVIAPSTPSASDSFGIGLAAGNFDHGAHSPGANTELDLAVGVPGRTVDSATAAGKVNVYKGAALTLWRQINETTSVQNP